MIDKLKKCKESGIKIIKILVFLGILCYLCVHISYVLRSETEAKKNLMGFYAEEENSLDVVAIGSSSIRSSLNPWVMYGEAGFNSYVIATSGQRPVFLKYLLVEAMKTQPDAVFVIDISTVRYDDEIWEKQNEGSIRQVTDGMKFSLNSLRCKWEIIKNKEDKLSYLFEPIKYHERWKVIGKTIVSYWDYEVPHKNKGYYLLDEIERQDYEYVEGEIEFIDHEAEKVLRDLLQYCKDEQISAEFTVAFNTNISYGKYVYLKKIVEEYGYNLFVFNEYMKEADINVKMDFKDASHTNISGAVKASKLFAKYLQGKYNFVDRRSSTNNNTWNDELNLKLEEIEEWVKKIEDEYSNYIGDLSINATFDGDTVTCNDITETNIIVQRAWYVYELACTGEWETVYTRKYKDSSSFSYELSKDKSYRIKLFLRNKDNTNQVKSKFVIEVKYSETNSEWVIKYLE